MNIAIYIDDVEHVFPIKRFIVENDGTILYYPKGKPQIGDTDAYFSHAFQRCESCRVYALAAYKKDSGVFSSTRIPIGDLVKILD